MASLTAITTGEGQGAILLSLSTLITALGLWMSKKISNLDTRNSKQHLDNQQAAQKIAVKASEAADVGANTHSLLQSIDTRLGGVNEVAAKMHEDIGAIRQWQVDHAALHARMENL